MGLHPDAQEWLDHIEAQRMGTGWRMIAFMFTTVGWMGPSAFVWFIGYVGLAGWGSENGTTDGLLDAPTSLAALMALTVAVVALSGAVALLIALARWAWPHRRREATIAAVVGGIWFPVFATVATIVAVAGRG